MSVVHNGKLEEELRQIKNAYRQTSDALRECHEHVVQERVRQAAGSLPSPGASPALLATSDAQLRWWCTIIVVLFTLWLWWRRRTRERDNSDLVSDGDDGGGGGGGAAAGAVEDTEDHMNDSWKRPPGVSGHVSATVNGTDESLLSQSVHSVVGVKAAVPDHPAFFALSESDSSDTGDFDAASPPPSPPHTPTNGDAEDRKHGGGPAAFQYMRSPMTEAKPVPSSARSGQYKGSIVITEAFDIATITQHLQREAEEEEEELSSSENSPSSDPQFQMASLDQVDPPYSPIPSPGGGHSPIVVDIPLSDRAQSPPPPPAHTPPPRRSRSPVRRSGSDVSSYSAVLFGGPSALSTLDANYDDDDDDDSAEEERDKVGVLRDVAEESSDADRVSSEDEEDKRGAGTARSSQSTSTSSSSASVGRSAQRSYRKQRISGKHRPRASLSHLSADIDAWVGDLPVPDLGAFADIPLDAGDVPANLLSKYVDDDDQHEEPLSLVVPVSPPERAVDNSTSNPRTPSARSLAVVAAGSAVPPPPSAPHSSEPQHVRVAMTQTTESELSATSSSGSPGTAMLSAEHSDAAGSDDGSASAQSSRPVSSMSRSSSDPGAWLVDEDTGVTRSSTPSPLPFADADIISSPHSPAG